MFSRVAVGNVIEEQLSWIGVFDESLEYLLHLKKLGVMPLLDGENISEKFEYWLPRLKLTARRSLWPSR